MMIAACLALAVLSACGGPAAPAGDESTPPSGDAQAPVTQSPSEPSGDGGEQTSGGFDTITRFSEEYDKVSEAFVNSDALNKLSINISITLAKSMMPIASGISFSIMDIENKDGEFGSKTEGYYNKSGSLATFGIEGLPAEQDNAALGTKAGDRTVSEGSYDSASHLYKFKRTSENGGVVQYRQYCVIQEKDGKFAHLFIEGAPEQEKSQTYTNCVFIIASEASYDFVFASSATVGAGFEEIPFDPDMTIAEAKAKFEAAGYTIENAGTIVGETFTPLA